MKRWWAHKRALPAFAKDGCLQALCAVQPAAQLRRSGLMVRAAVPRPTRGAAAAAAAAPHPPRQRLAVATGRPVARPMCPPLYLLYTHAQSIITL